MKHVFRFDVPTKTTTETAGWLFQDDLVEDVNGHPRPASGHPCNGFVLRENPPPDCILRDELAWRQRLPLDEEDWRYVRSLPNHRWVWGAANVPVKNEPS